MKSKTVKSVRNVKNANIKNIETVETVKDNPVKTTPDDSKTGAVHLIEIRHKNSILFEDATVPLDRWPVVIARGENRDATRVENPTNSVGKSLLYGAGLSVPLFNRVPASIRKSDGKSAFDVEDEGSIGISFDVDGHRHDVDVHSKRGKVRYDVRVDGKPKEFHKQSQAQDFVRKVFPFTEELTESLVYISARDPSVLQKGKPEDRMRLFQSIFDIDYYDRVYKAVSRRYNDMKLDVHKLADRRRELEEASRNWTDDPTLKAKADKISVSIEQVQTRIQSYMGELREVDAYLNQAEGLDPRAPKDPAKARSLLKKWQAERDVYNKTSAVYVRDKARWDEQEKAQKLRQDLAQQIEFHASRVTNDPSRVEWFAEKLREVEAAIAADETKLRRAAEVDLRIRALRLDPRYEKHLLDHKVTVAGLTRTNDRRKAEYARNIDEMQFLHSLKSSVSKKRTCPTCRQPVDVHRLNDMIQRMIKANDVIKPQIERADRGIEYLTLKAEWDTCKLDVDRVRRAKERKLKLETSLVEAQLNDRRRLMLESLRSQHAELETLVTLRQRPRAPARPRFLENLPRLERHCETLYRMQSLQRKYDSVEVARSRREALQSFVDEYAPRLTRAQKVHQHLTYKLADSDHKREQIERLSKDVATLKHKTRDFDVLEALREFSGSKGMRIVRIRNMADVYCKNLNRFAPLIFPEPIRFDVAVDRNTFDITATRGTKRKLTSDVRKLSGFESSAFMLLSMLALVPLIPRRRRTNLVIFDEIEIGLSRGQLDLLTREFIPQLSKLVDNLVFITPKSRSEFDVEGAHQLIVTKHHGASTVEGLGPPRVRRAKETQTVTPLTRRIVTKRKARKAASPPLLHARAA